MPVHLIRDADIKAISIVDKGANRKSFFLFKAEGDEPLEELGGVGRLVKAADYSAVYCVVAEPGAHESPGLVGDQSIDDRWASEEEIRKAAHRFMKNGGLMTKMHESLEPFGALVENAVAPADFTVNGETIRKGSWYIAFEPTAEGREAIDKGEFGGVSIEGLAVRELVEKGSSEPMRTVGVMDLTLLRKIGKAVGMTEAELEKANLTFGDIVTQREFEDALPEAFEAFREAVWQAFFPSAEEDFDPVTHLGQSCDEFKAWALGMLDKVPVEKAERAEALGVDPDGSSAQFRTFKSEDNMLTPDETARIEKLETEVAKIGTGIETLLEKAEAANEPEAPTAEGVAKSVEELTESLDGIKADIAKLGEGGSSQPADEPTSVEKSEAEAEAVKKAFENEGVSPALTGVLG